MPRGRQAPQPLPFAGHGDDAEHAVPQGLGRLGVDPDGPHAPGAADCASRSLARGATLLTKPGGHAARPLAREDGAWRHAESRERGARASSWPSRSDCGACRPPHRAAPLPEGNSATAGWSANASGHASVAGRDLLDHPGLPAIGLGEPAAAPCRGKQRRRADERRVEAGDPDAPAHAVAAPVEPGRLAERIRYRLAACRRCPGDRLPAPAASATSLSANSGEGRDPRRESMFRVLVRNEAATTGPGARPSAASRRRPALTRGTWVVPAREASSVPGSCATRATLAGSSADPMSGNAAATWRKKLRHASRRKTPRATGQRQRAPRELER